MSADRASALSDTPPDRLIARMGALVLAACLAIGLAGLGVGAWVAERNARMGALVALGAAERDLARGVAARLAAIEAMAPGLERRMARTVLALDLARLAEAGAARAARDGGAGAAEPGIGMILGARALVETPDGPSPAEIARLRAAFEGTIVPELDAATRALARRAAAERETGRILLLAALLGQILGAAAVGALVLRPGVAGARAWMGAAAEAEASARDRLLHDPVSQLPNATYLAGFLARLVGETGRRSFEAAVIHLALDRFQALRDALGPRTAGEIVRIAARRVEQSLRPGDFAAHLGHDQFVVVAADLDDPSDAAALAQRLAAALERPYAIPGGARRIGCAAGVSLLSDDRPEPERFLANAEIALAQARRRGGGGIRYFCERMRAEVEEREMLCAEILGGLERGEFVAFFQPQLALADGALVGFEALARWIHPERGLIGPRDFLDVAEQAGLTERLGEVILAHVLEALARWDAAGLAVPRVGVNFALAQLRDPALIERIKWDVDRRDIDPGRLAIEVLETVLIRNDTDLVVRNLRGLAGAGFHIDLDDFGTGHASISNLRRFMASRIKIDRSFVRGIDASDEQHRLIASIIAMARALGIRSLGEGVETAGEEAVLRALGCDEFQGYRIAHPMSEADATAWLAARAAAGAQGGPTALPAAFPAADGAPDPAAGG